MPLLQGTLSRIVRRSRAHLITVPWGYFYTLVRVEEGHNEGAFRQCDLTPPPLFPRSTLVDEVKFSAD